MVKFYMDRRRFERKNVSLEAVLISGGKSYAGIIKNFSEDGACVETTPTKTVTDLVPATTLLQSAELKFQSPSGEALNLRCEIIWLYTKKTPHNDLKQNNIGMEIIDPPPEYEAFIKSL